MGNTGKVLELAIVLKQIFFFCFSFFFLTSSMDYEFITDIEGKIINLYCLDQELNSWIIVMILYFLIPNIEPQQSEFTLMKIPS